MKECFHQIEPSGKVICDCFISALISALDSEFYDDADDIANIVHDVDNSLASERLAQLKRAAFAKDVFRA